MILSENQLSVPGKMYKVGVKCISTQRLTTIEWLILSCTKKFEHSDSMLGETLKYAFEEVFQFQNSELLIKPCLKHLCCLDVIRISGGDNFNYDNLCFVDIKLTELGEVMLKDGLLPGEIREIPLDIYYNPLTGKVSGYNNSITNAKEIIEFGTEADYSSEFPEQRIIDNLQSGAVGSGRFTASKFRIEEIEPLTSVDWECVNTLLVDVNSKGEIKTTPSIIEENAIRLLPELFLTKEINKVITPTLDSIEEVEVQSIIGSSKNIKSAILGVCKNGKTLYMDFRIYNLYKRNTSAFKDTTVFLFNDPDGFSIENDKNLFIHLSSDFFVNACVVSDERGNHVSLCKAEFSYGEYKILAPLAVEDRRLGKSSAIMDWLKNAVKSEMADNVSASTLYTLSVLNGNLKQCKEALYQRWTDMELSEILKEINVIYATCLQIKTEMFDIGLFADALMKKIDFSGYESALKSIRTITESNCIRKKSEAHKLVVETILRKLKKPETYSELFMLLQSLGITTHEDALKFDEIAGGLYDKGIMKDILCGIVNGKYSKLPELFEYDVFFNTYEEGLSQIENHVSGLKMFEMTDKELIRRSVSACPDIAGLQSYMAEVLSQNAYLMTKGINVYDVVRQEDSVKAMAFTDNMHVIEKAIEEELESVYQQVEEKRKEEPEKTEKSKLYVVDTCALIHHPDLLQYFKEDEYVRIPTKVIDELGKIKDKRNKKYSVETSNTARILARDISMYYLPLFNCENKIRLLIENAVVELLPKDLDPLVPDNQILSVALKYKNWETYIISDDGVFRLATEAQNIKTITSDEFIASHKESYKNLTEWIKEKNGKGSKNDSDAKEQNNVDSLVMESAATAEKHEEVFQKLSIDDLPIRELKKYTDMDEPVLAYLTGRGIKIIGDFRKLTESSVVSFPAKGKQVVYKNTVMRYVKQMDRIIPLIKLN